MRMSVFASFAATMLMGVCASAEASQRAVTAADAQAFMPIGRAVEAPRGYTDMCNIRPQLCRAMAPTTMVAQAEQVPARSDLLQTVAYGPTASIAAPQPLEGGLLRPVLARTVMSAPVNQAFDAPVAVRAQESTKSDLTAEQRMKLLNKVNRSVNSRVRAITDQALYGVEELWNRPAQDRTAAGDCEDFAIEKRQVLIDKGYPAEDLFFAVAFRADIGLHAVLVAHTDDGDYVLDNRSPYVTPWSRAPYVWLKRQSRENPAQWGMVQPPEPKAELTFASISPELSAQANGGR